MNELESFARVWAYAAGERKKLAKRVEKLERGLDAADLITSKRCYALAERVAELEAWLKQGPGPAQRFYAAQQERDALTARLDKQLKTLASHNRSLGMIAEVYGTLGANVASQWEESKQRDDLLFERGDIHVKFLKLLDSSLSLLTVRVTELGKPRVRPAWERDEAT